MRKILVIHPDDFWSNAPIQIGMISEDVIGLGLDMDIAEVRAEMTAEEAMRMYPIEQYEQVWIYSGEEYACVRHLQAAAHACGIVVLRRSFNFPS